LLVSQSLRNRFGTVANTGNLLRCIGRSRSAKNLTASSLQKRTSKRARHDHLSHRSFTDVWSRSGHVASTRVSSSQATRLRREILTMTMMTRTKTTKRPKTSPTNRRSCANRTKTSRYGTTPPAQRGFLCGSLQIRETFQESHTADMSGSRRLAFRSAPAERTCGRVACELPQLRVVCE
jgi:hypothetical protein